MTDEVKKQVKAEIDEAAKQQADTILQVYCQVYDKLPANLSEDEKVAELRKLIELTTNSLKESTLGFQKELNKQAEAKYGK